ncbi:MAG: quinone-dependent dihydroorotate dehydrogenase [Rhodospirillales bacterium]|nr:quinone-dependent dihydroorotate dehydrogenase [Rhodospirillales bacterium]
MIGFYELVGPVIRLFDPETAHGWAIEALRRGWVPRPAPVEDPRLQVELWGNTFASPVGLAAGFDKNAVVPDAMLRQGFSFVEVGGVTPRPQPGNPRPRLFRLSEDRAVITRFGFNNNGMEAMARQLAGRTAKAAGWVGINFGKNKETENAVDDYVTGINHLARYADFIVVNVSSPNTPGLRALQGKQPLAQLMRAVRQAVDGQNLKKVPPLLLKVAPDLTADDKRDIAAVVREEAVDGLIATNTTIERPATLKSRHRTESGGLSGQPLFAASTAVLADFYRLTDGAIPLIGVGGIGSGQQAYAKIRAGASLVQLYSALVYQGPGIAHRINRELLALLEADGFNNITQAIGADHRS